MLKLEQEVDEEEQKEHDMLHEMRRNEEIKEYSQQDHHVQEGEIDCRNENTRAAQIIDAMAICIEEDNQSNKNNLPALKKLQYTPTLLMDLKNLRVQECFLDMGGCKYLADWLSKLPDGSLPCINIIEAGLEIADFLPIEKEHLIESKLGKALEKIRKSKIKSQSIIMKCQEIINKWKRQILMLEESYDAEGAHEEQYREFKRKKIREAEYFQKLNKRQKFDDDDEVETKPKLTKQESLQAEGEGDDPKLKKEQSDGFYIPQKITLTSHIDQFQKQRKRITE